MRRRLTVVVVLFALTSAVAVAVWACDPPGVIINSPGDGGTVSGTTTIACTVESETEVQGVDIYLDDKLLATITEEPWEYEWDTTQKPNGSCELYVKARALDREDGVSETITITVSNKGS